MCQIILHKTQLFGFYSLQSSYMPNFKKIRVGGCRGSVFWDGITQVLMRSLIFGAAPNFAPHLWIGARSAPRSRLWKRSGSGSRPPSEMERLTLTQNQTNFKSLILKKKTISLKHRSYTKWLKSHWVVLNLYSVIISVHTFMKFTWNAGVEMANYPKYNF